MSFKITNKEFAIVRALAQVDGAVGEYYETAKEFDKTKEFFQSLVWLNDDLRGYYIGYDQSRDGYILEWRGNVRINGNSEYQKFRLLTYSGTGLVFDAVEAILDAIKKHKRFAKEWLAE